MKKKVLLGLLVCVVGLFSACSSDNNNDNKGGNTVVTGEKIIGFTDNKGNVLSDFKYDKQGRLVSVTLETNSDEGKEKNIITYKYSENLIEAQSTGDQKATSTFYLKNGKITNSTLKGDDSDVVECIYDSNDQLTKVITKDNSTNISWQKGNITQLSTQSKNYSIITKFVYTNHSAKNFIALSELEDCIPAIDGVDPILFMQGYYGKFVNNLVENAFTDNKPMPTPTDEIENITYTYTLNNKGKVVKVTDNKGNIGNYTWK